MGNELKLSLENFQSISKGELVFHTGTNVIIGQSNSGKTATFRALKACLSNPIGSQRFIKKGTKSSSVALEYNGNQIIWKRTPKESSYIINGEEFIKTGKSSAFKIMEDTGFVIDDNDTIMNIEEELQLPFPFGISKSELFKLYENVFCVSDSAIILKAAKEKEEQTKDTISSMENEIIKNENKLTEIENFKKEVNLDFLKEKKNYLKGNSDRISFLQDGLDIIHKAIGIQNFSVKESSFENKLQEYTAQKRLKGELKKLKELHSLGKTLKELKAPTAKDLTEYNELKGLSNTCSTLKKLKGVEAPIINFENKVQEYKDLTSYSLSLKELKNQIKAKKEALKEIEGIIQVKESKLKEFKVCPLCHKPLN